MTKEPEIHINFSNLKKFIPYTFILPHWKMGRRYKNFFYLFDAILELPHANRSFKLLLPAQSIERELYPIRLAIKQAENVRITFEKLDKGRINIIKLEPINLNIELYTS